MNHIEGNFKGKQGLSLYYQGWLPDKETKAVLIIVHGVAEHSGRYSNLVNYLVPRGFAVYGADHRGHGKSEGQKGHVEHFSYYTGDLHTFFTLVRSRHPNLKIFLFGHSMGATIGLSYVQQYQRELAGLIVSGTALLIKPNLPVFIKAMMLPIAKFFPKMGITKLDSEALSRDKSVVEAYDSDPLVYRGKLSARLIIEFVWTMVVIERELSTIRLPIMIMHGSADRIADPAGAQIVSQRVSSPDKTVKFYDGLYHEILNEPERQQVLADLEAWLNGHV